MNRRTIYRESFTRTPPSYEDCLCCKRRTPGLHRFTRGFQTQDGKGVDALRLLLDLIDAAGVEDGEEVLVEVRRGPKVLHDRDIFDPKS